MSPDNKTILRRLIVEELGSEFACFELREDFGPSIDELSLEALCDLAHQTARHIRYARTEGFLDLSSDAPAN